MPFHDVWLHNQAFIADLLRSATVPDHWPAFVIISAFLVLLSLEVHIIRRNKHLTPTLRQSYRTNLATFLFNDVMMSLLSISSLLLLAEHYGTRGLLHQIEDLPAKAVIAFVLFDLTIYLWHKANHQLNWLWIFHKVHHSDRSMNVTTAFRLHFGELLLTTAVKAGFIIVTGVEMAVVAACEAVAAIFVLFHHAKITFRAEKWLGLFIIVPSLHRVHHSTKRAEHDNNYGQVFSVWDRIFHTFRTQRPVEIGLANINGQTFLELLTFGFAAPRPQTPTPSPIPTPAMLNGMIAEAAFYKAELRGFAPGWDVADWLVAEQEIMERLPQS